MKNKSVSRISESGWRRKNNLRSLNRQTRTRRVTSLLASLRNNESDLRAFIDQSVFTASLAAAILGPLFVVTVALGGLLIFGAVILIYTFGGTLGVILIARVRKNSRATSVVPKSSDEHPSDLTYSAFDMNEKAA